MKRHSLFSLVFALLAAAPLAHAQPLQVCATLPDLGSIAQTIGGDQVQVTTFAKGAEDPHFVEARPSFVKALSHADLFIEQGLELEVGWAPVLQKNARNPAILAGGAGHLDASTAIKPLEVPAGQIDRSLGDVHAAGNPHYMLDPMNGLLVAVALRDKLAELRPAAKADFEKNYQRFRADIAEKMVGKELAAKYDVEKLAMLDQLGKLDEFLTKTDQSGKLGGWLGQVHAFRGAPAVDDHPQWTYFVQRFGLRIVEHLEPKPGISPTTRHLGEVVDLMGKQHVQLLISTPYFDPRHAEFVAQRTGAKIAHLAHQTGAVPGADDYAAMIDHNVKQIAAAIGGSSAK